MNYRENNNRALNVIVIIFIIYIIIYIYYNIYLLLYKNLFLLKYFHTFEEQFSRIYILLKVFFIYNKRISFKNAN